MGIVQRIMRIIAIHESRYRVTGRSRIDSGMQEYWVIDEHLPAGEGMLGPFKSSREAHRAKRRILASTIAAAERLSKESA
ncbi:hypothetical protein [Methylosinus sp. PW1]|uniref:hypothetical protein n=1 Tax=Methylosinus sp. PW1 TaxID=107636 RepID=UPI000561583A|nr:hypothetical protein [Methylosinus sp. PW1]